MIKHLTGGIRGLLRARGPVCCARAGFGLLLFCAAGTAFCAVKVKTGGWAAGGQNIYGSNLHIAPSMISGGLGWARSSADGMDVGGGFVNASAIPYDTATPLAPVHAYPVPFKPSAGHTKITFKGLAHTAAVKIYDLAGESVRSLTKADENDYLDWDVTNDARQSVASGVYFYVVKTDGRTQTGKLMIIR